MKLFVCFLLTIIPFVVCEAKLVTSAFNSFEKDEVSKTSNNTLKDIGLNETNDLASKTKTVGNLIQIIPSDLQPIPVYEGRNPSVKTINYLEPQVSVSSEKSVQSKNKTTPIELPVPFRCPQITGTAKGNFTYGFKSQFNDSEARAAQRGCRFFIVHELIDRKQTHEQHISFQMNLTLQKCFNSCINAYDNGTNLNEACFEGCNKTYQVTEAVKNTIPNLNDELEREGETSNPETHRTFSIIIPLRTMEPTSDDRNSDTFSSMMPNAVKMMLQMMHQMAERARNQMFDSQNEYTKPTNIQESESSIDSSGNSISVSRSMSVLMARDKDGHSKMVVVHTLPKLQVHRFSTFLNTPLDENDELSHRFKVSEPKEPSNLDDEENIFDDDSFQFKLLGRLSNLHNVQQKNDLILRSSNKLCLTRYLPRLFFIIMIILVLYLICWLFCAFPTSFYGRLFRNSSGSISVISSPNMKRSKFFFSKDQKYFQINNKNSSTTSLPPPYPGENDNSICAEPLPAKQLLPSTDGFETKSWDK